MVLAKGGKMSAISKLSLWRRQTWRRALIFLLALVVILAGAVVFLPTTSLLPAPWRRPVAPPPAAANRDDRWRQDVDYLVSQLGHLHANAFHQNPPQAFTELATRLKAQLPTLADHEIMTEMLRIVALVGDGHTRAYVHSAERFRTYPLQLFWFADGLYVTAATAEYKEAVGQRLIAIDNWPIEEAYAAIVSLVPHDNEAGLKNDSPQWLVTPEILAAVGIIADMEHGSYTLARPDGSQFSISLAPVSVDEPLDYVTAADLLSVNAAPPLFLQNSDDDYWYTYLEESGTLYIQYNACRNKETQPFSAFTDEVLAFADGHDVRRLVIDVRLNGGGNSAIFRPLLDGIKERPALNQHGTLFVIIGRSTFSSALWNALELKKETAAILVGEETGGKPNSYGEVRRFKLPNSDLTIQYSTRFWQLLKTEDPPSLAPDLPAGQTMADYAAGRDPVLETILSYETP
jgi:hypothetical protein